MRKTSIAALLLAIGGCTDATSTPATASKEQAVAAGGAQVPASFLRTARRIQRRQEPHNATGPSLAAAARQQPTIDTLTNFSGQFTVDGFDSQGNPQSVWPFTMVGRDPAQNRTTSFRAPVIPVTVELLDANGNVGKTATGAPLRQVAGQDTVQLTLNSPVFQRFPWSSGNVQYTDGLMRAQFFNQVGDRESDRDNQGYHTVLQPTVRPTRTLQLPFGSYFFAPKADGTCCAFVLADVNVFANLLFPATPDDTTSVIGAAEHAGDMRTTDITSLLFRDIFLFIGDPGNCCILGFHSVDVEPGDASNGNRLRAFVFDFASYISDGLFGGGFEDVTALSHEVAELFADPFINNATPWWLSVDPFTGAQLCQNNLENGDVVEVLSSNPVHAVPTRTRTYHPQNVALLQWFEFQQPPTDARLGALSFPDETTLLTTSPGPLQVNCAPAQ